MGSFLKNKTANALIIHFGAIGDIICALPGIISLSETQSVDICCSPHIFPIIQHFVKTNQIIDCYHPLITSIFMPGRTSEIKNWLLSYEFIVLISFSQDWETHLKTNHPKICRIPPRPPTNENTHTAKFIVNAFQKNGLINENQSRIEDFILHKKSRSYRIPQSRSQNFLIHPGSGSPLKNWPLDRFVSLSRELKQQGYSSHWIVGPAESKMLPLLTQYQVSQNDIIQTDQLERIMAVINQANHYIGNDSGMTHLAAIMGVTSTIIFGPSDARRWKPIGSYVNVISQDTSCPPCFETGSKTCAHRKCLHQISVSQVLQVVLSH